MKKIVFFGVCIVLGTTILFAQGNEDLANKKTNCASIYDPATSETVKGSIESILTIAKADKPHCGAHLMVKTETETMEVHLGPVPYLKKQHTEFFIGDNIMITGSRIYYEGIEVIIARKIEKNGEVVHFRDQNGLPLWTMSPNRGFPKKKRS